MEALQFDPSSKILSLRNLPIPKISADDEIIIEVAYAGVCGTDLHIIEGDICFQTKPWILGHEYSGIVREIGSAVNHVKPGDRVVLDPQCWCTTCVNCTTGKYHLCLLGGLDHATGVSYDGGWARYAKARARQIYKLPPSISLRQGALGEPVSCIVWGYKRGVQQALVGSSILITGAGIIGNLWSAILYHLGHRNVTVVEPSPERREINRRLGTGYRCLSPEELKNKLDEGERFDLAVECSGNKRAIEQVFDALRTGGTLLIFGVASPEIQVSLSPYEIFKRELTIIGTIINPFSMKNALELLDSMGNQYINYESLGICEYDIKDYKEAISRLKSGVIAKVMFTVNPNLE